MSATLERRHISPRSSRCYLLCVYRSSSMASGDGLEDSKQAEPVGVSGMSETVTHDEGPRPRVANSRSYSPSATKPPLGNDCDGGGTSSSTGDSSYGTPAASPEIPTGSGDGNEAAVHVANRSVRERPISKHTLERALEFLVKLEVDERTDTPEEKHKKRVLRMALKVSKDCVQELDGKVERRNKQIDGLKYEIYQLVALFALFSGVLFTAVTQPNRLRRQHLWIPITLSTFAYVVVALVTQEKFEAIQSLRKNLENDKEEVKSARNLIIKLRAFGYQKFSFTEHAPELEARTRQKPTSNASIYAFACLTVFWILLWTSMLHIFLTNGPSAAECLKWCQ